MYMNVGSARSARLQSLTSDQLDSIPYLVSFPSVVSLSSQAGE
jgi:hypothetical protein